VQKSAKLSRPNPTRFRFFQSAIKIVSKDSCLSVYDPISKNFITDNQESIWWISITAEKIFEQILDKITAKNVKIKLTIMDNNLGF
jgi:hypothetical protein